MVFNLNVGTVSMLCILNVGTVPTFRHFLLEINQGLKHAIVYNKQYQPSGEGGAR